MAQQRRASNWLFSGFSLFLYADAPDAQFEQTTAIVSSFTCLQSFPFPTSSVPCLSFLLNRFIVTKEGKKFLVQYVRQAENAHFWVLSTATQPALRADRATRQKERFNRSNWNRVESGNSLTGNQNESFPTSFIVTDVLIPFWLHVSNSPKSGS